MREIKFRAWNGSRLVPVSEICQEFESYSSRNSSVYLPTKRTIVLANGEYLKFDPMISFDERLMQYTGLKDKDGTDIYEGDILDYFTLRKIVAWNAELAMWGLKRTLDESSRLTEQLATVDLEKSTVVGNIYEHPDRLTLRRQ